MFALTFTTLINRNLLHRPLKWEHFDGIFEISSHLMLQIKTQTYPFSEVTQMFDRLRFQSFHAEDSHVFEENGQNMLVFHFKANFSSNIKRVNVRTRLRLIDTSDKMWVNILDLNEYFRLKV